MTKYKLIRKEVRIVHIIVPAKSKAEAIEMADGDWEQKTDQWKPLKWQIVEVIDE